VSEGEGMNRQRWERGERVWQSEATYLVVKSKGWVGPGQLGKANREAARRGGLGRKGGLC